MRAVDLLVDASVAVKWFQAEGEDDVPAARAVLAAVLEGRLGLGVLDLTAYELGNVLRRRGRQRPAVVAAALRAMARSCTTIAPAETDLARAVDLADEWGLTFYDAAYAAVAAQRGLTLVTVDRELLRLPWCEHVATVAARLT